MFCHFNTKLKILSSLFLIIITWYMCVSSTESMGSIPDPPGIRSISYSSQVRNTGYQV